MTTTRIFAAAVALTLAEPAQAASPQDWDTASSLGEALLVAAAIGLPAADGDSRGSLEAAGSIAGAFAVTEGLKTAFPELRPDRSDRRSFPSGHTSVSFAAAASLHQRRGWRVGLPATLAAAFVGFARVEANKHHWYDVAAGAAIGEAAGMLITSPRESRVRLFPWGDTHGGGVAVTMRF
jgi:membrane-associated phospholipid phosphatase